MTKPENDNLGSPVALQKEEQPVIMVSAKWLGVFWALALVAGLSFYVVSLSNYPSDVTLFPRVISLPTLGLAVAYLVKELVNLRRNRRQMDVPSQKAIRSEITSGSSDGLGPVEIELSIEPSRSDPSVSDREPAQVRVTGLGLAVGLAVVYVVLLGVLGFAIDSVALIVGGPLLYGQPLRRAPVFLVAGVVFVIILSVLVHLSGVFPLPTGAFHVGVS